MLATPPPLLIHLCQQIHVICLIQCQNGCITHCDQSPHIWLVSLVDQAQQGNWSTKEPNQGCIEPALGYQDSMRYTRNGCKMSCEVVPDNSHPFRPQCALMYTIPDIKKKLFPIIRGRRIFILICAKKPKESHVT